MAQGGSHLGSTSQAPAADQEEEKKRRADKFIHGPQRLTSRTPSQAVSVDPRENSKNEPRLKQAFGSGARKERKSKAEQPLSGLGPLNGRRAFDLRFQEDQSESCM